MPIPKHHTANLDTIQQAADNGDLALIEVREKSTGEIRTALCAIGFDGEEYGITPFALMIDGNPFEMLDPPDPEGGFHG